MKHLSYYFLIVFFSLAISASSQQDHLRKGDKLLSVYAGFVNPAPFTFSIFSFSGAGNPSPSANINYQYAITDRITLGPFASYYKVDADYTNTVDQFESLLQSDGIDELLGGLDCLLLGNCDNLTVTERISVFTVGGKISYTRRVADALETYLSMHLGYSINKRQTIAEGVLNSVSDELGLGVQVPSFVYFTSVGGRLFLNEKYALFGEFGYGNSHLLTVGVIMRMGY